MASSVAPAPIFPSSTSTLADTSTVDFPTDTSAAENVATAPVSNVNDPCIKLYAKLHRLNIIIGLLICLRIAVLGILFLPWSFKSFKEYPMGYEPEYLFFEKLDLEGLIIPYELRQESILRYVFAGVFVTDVIVCLSTSTISFCTSNLSWILLLCVFWFCFMLVSLIIYTLGAFFFISNNRYITLLYLHLTLVPCNMLLLTFNIIYVRKLTKMGVKYLPEPSMPKTTKQKTMRNRNKSQVTLKPSASVMDNQAMYNNIFGDPGPNVAPSPAPSSQALNDPYTAPPTSSSNLFTPSAGPSTSTMPSSQSSFITPIPPPQTSPYQDQYGSYTSATPPPNQTPYTNNYQPIQFVEPLQNQPRPATYNNSYQPSQVQATPTPVEPIQQNQPRPTTYNNNFQPNQVQASPTPVEPVQNQSRPMTPQDSNRLNRIPSTKILPTDIPVTQTQSNTRVDQKKDKDRDKDKEKDKEKDKDKDKEKDKDKDKRKSKSKEKKKKKKKKKSKRRK